MSVSSATATSAVASSPADRRRSVRYRRAAPVTVQVKDGPQIPAMTIEISVSGLSAVLSAPVTAGEVVELCPIAGGTVTAQVRHAVGKVYGFQFLKITQKQMRKIIRECLNLPIYTGNHLGI
jgi:hypothetical protein